MANLQVRGIEDRLYEALRAKAELDNRSISQEVVTIIEQFLARPETSGKMATEAFLSLAGSWQDDRKPAEIAADIRKARRSRPKTRRTDDVLA